MKNPKKIVIWVVIFIFVITSFYFAFAWGRELWPFETKYQVVALANGEVYYGRLTFFPLPKIVDPWLFQQVPAEKEGEKPETKLVPFGSLFFGPENVLYLEKDQIVWWSHLRKDSEVFKFIKSQGGTQITPKAESPEMPEGQ